MTRKQKYYVVTMYRWSNLTSYVWGVFSSKTKAVKAGLDRQESHGGNKYFPEVIEFDFDNPESKKVILRKEEAENWNWWKE